VIFAIICSTVDGDVPSTERDFDYLIFTVVQPSEEEDLFVSQTKYHIYMYLPYYYYYTIFDQYVFWYVRIICSCALLFMTFHYPAAVRRGVGGWYLRTTLYIVRCIIYMCVCVCRRWHNLCNVCVCVCMCAGACGAHTMHITFYDGGQHKHL